MITAFTHLRTKLGLIVLALTLDSFDRSRTKQDILKF